MKTVLITGATGLLGTCASHFFAINGWSVTCLVRCSNKSHHLSTMLETDSPSAQIRIVEADIADLNSLRLKLSARHFTTIIHCAALTDLSTCERFPETAYRTHVVGTRNLVNALRSDLFVYISTDSVFDGANSPYNEKSECNPLNMYARTKWLGEKEAEKHKKPIVARLNLFAIRRQHGKSLADWAYSRLTQGELILGYDNVFFNPLHTYQISKILHDLIEIDFTGVLNIASDKPISKFVFLTRLADALGFNSNLIQPKKYINNDLVIRPLDTTLCNEQLKLLLPNVDTNLDNGIQHVAKTIKQS